MALIVRCTKCQIDNQLPDSPSKGRSRCGRCGAFLPPITPPSGEASAAVGLIGGAALGAALGGPPGAIIGGLIGAILGGQAKGVG